jgi:hypothetical protein
MANLLTTKELRSLENKKRWAERTKVAAPKPTTPTGRDARIKEFRDLLLNATTGKKILERVISIATDDEHPGQMAALKMCVDRLVPQSYFENQKDQGRTQIAISITGLTQAPTPLVIENE